MDMMPLIPDRDENENPNAQEEQKKNINYCSNRIGHIYSITFLF